MSTEPKTAADILNDTTLKLHYIHSVLDLVCTVARAKDPCADIESLEIVTLDNALSGVMNEVEEIQQAIQGSWRQLVGRSPGAASTSSKYSDDTGPRIQAFLGSMRPLSDGVSTDNFLRAQSAKICPT